MERNYIQELEIHAVQKYIFNVQKRGDKLEDGTYDWVSDSIQFCSGDIKSILYVKSKYDIGQVPNADYSGKEQVVVGKILGIKKYNTVIMSENMQDVEDLYSDIIMDPLSLENGFYRRNLDFYHLYIDASKDGKSNLMAIPITYILDIKDRDFDYYYDTPKLVPYSDDLLKVRAITVTQLGPEEEEVARILIRECPKTLKRPDQYKYSMEIDFPFPITENMKRDLIDLLREWYVQDGDDREATLQEVVDEREYS